ncbi:AI-2E family transporter [Salinarimonas ramus]|uniref:AI-2E family transporter n=1 Tax=Salinarimonas ramus TaxID=690164 RepID=A0A917V186_9HYPH|nr:AI-2E family transporter [Salinarimonas ramus]GGK17369.1 AI-2E family transporter [Salinarimonas ramus]
MPEDETKPATRTTRAQGARRGDFAGVEAGFVRKVLVVLAVVAIAYALYNVAYVLVLAFGALLLGIIIRAFVRLVERIPGLPEPAAFYVGLLVLVALLVGFGFFFTMTMQSQVRDVVEQLPQAIESLGERFDIQDPVQRLEERFTEASGSGTTLMGRAANIGFTVLGGLVDVGIVLFAAIYLAYDPSLYRRGLVHLFPPEQHERIDAALVTTGNALELWFFGQLVSMALVGLLTGLGFWWVGLPAPAALGLIAGVTNFIPFLGPFLGSAPALVFAFGEGMNAVWWTIGIVVVVQQLEGNLFLPLIQRRAVSLAPAFALFAIVAFGLLWGFLGVFLAVPMAVTIMVLVKMLWMRDTLGEETDVPGEADGEDDGETRDH